MTVSYPRIPYGEADIRRIRLQGWLYVDKTRFLRRLELFEITRERDIRSTS